MPAHAIAIDVDTRFLAEESAPEDGHYVFAYTVRIRNEGDAPARLVSRHWVITDANGRVQEVRGDGVVGEQPRLRPGESYEYTSGAVLETGLGQMYGSYRMVADDGSDFEAPIAPFTLSVPRVLH